MCKGEPDGRCTNNLDLALCEDMSERCLRRNVSTALHSHFLHIHKHQICDGVPDCQGGIDEKEGCDKKVYCSEGSRTFIDSVTHIPERWLCDGVSDCLDGSDENVTAWLRCEDESHCYTPQSHCAGVTDCPDGSDESSCGKLIKTIM